MKKFPKNPNGTIKIKFYLDQDKIYLHFLEHAVARVGGGSKNKIDFFRQIFSIFLFLLNFSGVEILHLNKIVLFEDPFGG